jgi:hypothetical protein
MGTIRGGGARGGRGCEGWAEGRDRATPVGGCAAAASTAMRRRSGAAAAAAIGSASAVASAAAVARRSEFGTMQVWGTPDQAASYQLAARTQFSHLTLPPAGHCPAGAWQCGRPPVATLWLSPPCVGPCCLRFPSSACPRLVWPLALPSSYRPRRRCLRARYQQSTLIGNQAALTPL